MLRQLSLVNRELLAGIWMQRKGQQLSEKTIGLIGLGAVGKEAAHLFKAFDCKILAYDLIDQRDFCNKNAIQQMELDDLLKTADIISLHLPLTDETKLILNKDRLQSMKQTAILINTARGNLVDEVALKELLQTQCIGGAAFDVFANEPPADRTLLGLANFFATPHIGGSTDEAILAMGYAAIAGLESAALL